MADDKTIKTAKKWGVSFVSGSFAVALALLFVLVLRSLAVQITPPPEPRNEPYPDVTTQELCEAEGGRWLTRPTKGEIRAPQLQLEVDSQPYCQGPLKYERDREVRYEASQQTSLFVFAIGGALVVALALLVTQLKPVAPGFMLGGIVSFFIAGVQIWQLTPGLGRLITIVVIFVVLVGIGLHALKDK